jgi:2',3'-cyclic-nucleotide 2'-phosphodiesterase (5'-nucleotidase family)
MQLINTVLKTCVLLVMATLLSGCGGGGGGEASAEQTSSGSGVSGLPVQDTELQTPLAAADRTISFMHYNDLHAHLNPHLDRVPDGRGGSKLEERGGVARAATLIKQIRAENPDSVLMNIGDTYHGGAEAWFTLGNAIVPPVNALGIDVGVPGNWDFGYSSTIFRMRYTSESPGVITADSDPLRPSFDQVLRPNFPNLAANMSYTSSGENVLPATLIKDINGVKVGFIGLTSDIVKFVYALLAPAFTFTGEDLDAASAALAYRDLINRHAGELRGQGADIVVVMSELGIHKDHQLAHVIDPGAVDVFFSAHTHEATFEPLRSSSGALVVEAGNDGWLGRMDIRLNRAGQVVARDWQLLPIDARLATDPEVQRLVDLARAPFMAPDVHFVDPLPNSAQAFVQPLDTVLGHVRAPLDRRDAMESTFNNGMTDILRHYTGTDLAMSPGFRFDSVIGEPGVMLEDNTLLNGAVTVEDAYRFFPMMFAVATGQVSGARLREIIENSLTRSYSAEAFNHQGGWLEGWSGLSLTLDLAGADGQRVVDMRLKDSGQLITDATVVSVTGCKRPIEPRDMLCRHSGFSLVTPYINSLTRTGEPWTVLDLLIEALTNGVPFDAQRQDIVDISSTPVWPQTDFIQPVRDIEQ